MHILQDRHCFVLVSEHQFMFIIKILDWFEVNALSVNLCFLLNPALSCLNKQVGQRSMMKKQPHIKYTGVFGQGCRG